MRNILKYIGCALIASVGFSTTVEAQRIVIRYNSPHIQRHTYQPRVINRYRTIRPAPRCRTYRSYRNFNRYRVIRPRVIIRHNPRYHNRYRSSRTRMMRRNIQRRFRR